LEWQYCLLCFEQNNENKGKTFFVVEMPNYKLPLFKNVAINVIEKTKFVYGAEK
jgi:Fe2+ transport system protein B